jgi:hypothetical protein
MTICDGCGQPADANHTRERIERLEMATRFRPIHIHTLAIDACPPAPLSDFFYNLGIERTAAGRARFDELSKCAADAATKVATSGVNDEAVLIEWQRRGLFLAYAVDCPIADPAVLGAALERAGKTLVLRLNTSYRPKFVALLSKPTAGLIPILQSAGWSDKLILDAGQPFEGPGFGEQLNRAIAAA